MAEFINQASSLSHQLHLTTEKEENLSATRMVAETDHFPTELPEDLREFRKPATTNKKDWWYISQAQWDEAIDKASGSDSIARKAGKQTLRRWDHAGRIMETSAGIRSQLLLASLL
jgi:hypothetical protein